jgi:hypothetical protein
MARTLPDARAAFVSAMKRDTSGTELTRLVAVIDALIKWSVARPKSLAFHDADSAPGIISFALAGSKTICWTARVTRGDAPKLELFPPGGRSLSPEARAKLVEMLNAHSRLGLADDGRLRISFGALKNAAALEAVTGLLGEVLTADPRPATAVS